MSKQKPWQQQAPQSQAALAQNAQTQALGSANAASQLGAQQAPPVVAKPVAAIPPGAITLDHPTIELGEHIFVGSPPSLQTNRLKPEHAYVYQGAIVIEELNLILPLACNYVRTR